jgi:Cft2 family RNA processing exonuclease
MALGALTLTVLVIIAGCAGLAFLFYRMIRQNTEAYFQFDEENRGPP